MSDERQDDATRAVGSESAAVRPISRDDLTALLREKLSEDDIAKLLDATDETRVLVDGKPLDVRSVALAFPPGSPDDAPGVPVHPIKRTSAEDALKNVLEQFRASSVVAFPATAPSVDEQLDGELRDLFEVKVGDVIRFPPPSLGYSYVDGTLVEQPVSPPQDDDDALGASLGEMVRVVAISFTPDKPRDAFFEATVIVGRWHRVGSRVRYKADSVPWILAHCARSAHAVDDHSALTTERLFRDRRTAEGEWRNYLAPCPNCQKEYRLGQLVPEGQSPQKVLTCSSCRHRWQYRVPTGTTAPEEPPTSRLDLESSPSAE